MLHYINDDEREDPYNEFILIEDEEKDEEAEEAERLVEIENELYSYVHYGLKNDLLETETVEPKTWISLEKQNSAANRPLMRHKVDGSKKVNRCKKEPEDVLTAKTYICNNCSLIGHLSRDCRQMKKIVCYICGIVGHMSRDCPNRICFNCECPGHFARDCNESRRSYNVYCFRCHMTGHKDYECPDLWRRYHVTTKVGSIVKAPFRCNPRIYCYNCGACGHFAYECDKVTMYKHIQPTYPFIISYNNKIKTTKTRKVWRKNYTKITVIDDKVQIKKQKIKKEGKIKKLKSKKKGKNAIENKKQMNKEVKRKIKSRKRRKNTSKIDKKRCLK